MQYYLLGLFSVLENTTPFQMQSTNATQVGIIAISPVTSVVYLFNLLSS
jgi:hypothetical protein